MRQASKMAKIAWQSCSPLIKIAKITKMVPSNDCSKFPAQCSVAILTIWARTKMMTINMTSTIDISTITIMTFLIALLSLFLSTCYRGGLECFFPERRARSRRQS